MLRLAFDLDGTLADLASAYHGVERRLFGGASSAGGADPVAREDTTATRHDDIWKAITETHDFWTTLAPLEPGVLPGLFEMSQDRRWEIFFVTQRPPTAGETVQRQTHRWLVEQGFPTPSVLTVPGSRGRLAAALHFDYLVDDLEDHCIDAVSDSRCRPFHVLRDPDPAPRVAKIAGIQRVASVAEAIAIIAGGPQAEAMPGFVQRVLKRLRFD